MFKEILGRFLARKQLHEVEKWTQDDAAQFAQLVLKMAPVILQSAEVLLGDAQKARALFEAYQAAGAKATGGGK